MHFTVLFHGRCVEMRPRSSELEFYRKDVEYKNKNTTACAA